MNRTIVITVHTPHNVYRRSLKEEMLRAEGYSVELMQEKMKEVINMASSSELQSFNFRFEYDVDVVEGVTSTLLLTAQQLQRSDMTIQVFAE